jgi:hypothetical protein
MVRYRNPGTQVFDDTEHESVNTDNASIGRDNAAPVLPKQIAYDGRYRAAKNTETTSPPPLTDTAWDTDAVQLADTKQFIGDRISPTDILSTANGWLMVYNFYDDSGESSLDFGTGLAWSPDLEQWHDTPASPILDTVPPWYDSTIPRARGKSIAYNPDNEEWIMLVNSRVEDSSTVPGDRASGIARSDNLVDWAYDSDPLVTVDDLGAWHTTSDVYSDEIIYHDGQWWILTGQAEEKGFVTTTDLTTVSDLGSNPLVDSWPAWFTGNLPKVSSVTRHNDRWYIPIVARDTGDFGLLYADSLDVSNWTQAADNPILNSESQGGAFVLRTEVELVQKGGAWRMLFSAAQSSQQFPLDLYSIGGNYDMTALSPDRRDWTDVTASRSAGTPAYTNDAGRPIEVSISLEASAADTAIGTNLIVDGVSITRDVLTVGNGQGITISATIPAGADYYLNLYSDTADYSIKNWYEL